MNLSEALNHLKTTRINEIAMFYEDCAIINRDGCNRVNKCDHCILTLMVGYCGAFRYNRQLIINEVEKTIRKEKLEKLLKI